jgi:hypothetical protein
MRICLLAVAVLSALPGCFLLKECDAGEMRCNGETAQMCDSSGDWEDWQKCGSIGEQCYSDPSSCSGYSGISCCR